LQKINNNKPAYDIRVAPPGELPEIATARHAAYSRFPAYQAGFTQTLLQPDELDLSGDAVVLVARDSADKLLGSVRIVSNLKLKKPLPKFAADAITFPAEYSFVDRFFVTETAPRSVAAALLRAIWEWSLSTGKTGMVAMAGVALAANYKTWGGLLPLTAEPHVVPEDLREPVQVVGALMLDAYELVGKLNPKFQATLTPPHVVEPEGALA